MSNDYSAIKTNQSSTKFVLIRINPARFVNDDLVLDSGTIYNMTFPFDVSAVTEQGSSLTKVSSSPSSGEYTFNESTGELSVHLGAAPSSTNAIVVFYYIYLTIDRFRVVGKNPSSPTVDLREWEPKIVKSPRVRQTIKNVFNGLLSISTSNLVLINDNKDFNKYLTDNDSFYNKTVEVWHFLESIENFRQIYKGRIASLNIDRTKVNLKLNDDIELLSRPAFMKDEKVFFTNENFTNIQSVDRNKPVRFYFGTVSRYDTIPESVTNLTDAQKLNPELMDEAICTNYTTNISTSNNREWACGRVGYYGTTDFSFTPVSVDNSDANFTRLDTTSGISPLLHIGDTFIISGSGTYYERILYIDRVNHYVYITKNASVVSTDTVNSNVCPSIVIRNLQNNYFYPLYGRDYTAAETTLQSGNKLIEVTFANNFESTLSMGTLDPGIFQVFYKIKPDSTNQNHSDVLSEVLENADLTLNASSFSTAKSTFNVNANFSIPFFDETAFSPYYRYVESIISSTIGNLHLNSSFELVYELFDSPSSGGESVTKIEILRGSHSYKVDYKDIVTQLIGFNPHYNSSEFVDTSSSTGVNNKAIHLHEIENTDRFRHVLEDFSTKIDDHINLKSERFLAHTFETKGINFDSEIGDDLTISEIDLPGNIGSENLTIIEIDKDNLDTRIVATDLLNL